MLSVPVFLLHLIDSYSDDIVKAYTTIRAELKAYSQELAAQPEIVALTKTEGLDLEIIADLISQLQPELATGSENNDDFVAGWNWTTQLTS